MRHVHLFLQLRPAEQRLLLLALPLVVLVRLCLWLLPVRLWRSLLRPAAGRSDGTAGRNPPTAARIAWAVVLVSRYVPEATCLTQALATRALLARYGYAGDLRIGVAKSDSGRLEAHAWIEHDGRILVGGPAAHVARYTPLPALECW